MWKRLSGWGRVGLLLAAVIATEATFLALSIRASEREANEPFPTRHDRS